MALVLSQHRNTELQHLTPGSQTSDLRKVHNIEKHLLHSHYYETCCLDMTTSMMMCF